MFTLIQILFYGWPSRADRSAAGEINEILFEQRNKSYGAYELRRNEGWYLLTALSLVVGIGGTLLLGSMWWWPQSKAETVKSITVCICMAPYCPVFAPPIPLPFLAALPNASFHRDGESQVKYPKERFSLPVPSPIVPHYGPGIGNAQGDGLDGWLLPSLPGEDEEVPEVMKSKYDEFYHALDIEELPDLGVLIIPETKEEVIPEATNCGIWVDEEPRPINLQEIYEKLKHSYGLIDHRMEGTVVVRILINKRGEYEKHRTLSASHPVLCQEVEKYITQIRWTPRIREGRPIKFWVNVPFRFRMID